MDIIVSFNIYDCQVIIFKFREQIKGFLDDEDLIKKLKCQSHEINSGMSTLVSSTVILLRGFPPFTPVKHSGEILSLVHDILDFVLCVSRSIFNIGIFFFDEKPVLEFIFFCESDIIGIATRPSCPVFISQLYAEFLTRYMQLSVSHDILIVILRGENIAKEYRWIEESNLMIEGGKYEKVVAQMNVTNKDINKLPDKDLSIPDSHSIPSRDIHRVFVDFLVGAKSTWDEVAGLFMICISSLLESLTRGSNNHKYCTRILNHRLSMIEKARSSHVRLLREYRNLLTLNYRDILRGIREMEVGYLMEFSESYVRDLIEELNISVDQWSGDNNNKTIRMVPHYSASKLQCFLSVFLEQGKIDSNNTFINFDLAMEIIKIVKRIRCASHEDTSKWNTSRSLVHCLIGIFSKHNKSIEYFLSSFNLCPNGGGECDSIQIDKDATISLTHKRAVILLNEICLCTLRVTHRALLFSLGEALEILCMAYQNCRVLYQHELVRYRVTEIINGDDTIETQTKIHNEELNSKEFTRHDTYIENTLNAVCSRAFSRVVITMLRAMASKSQKGNSTRKMKEEQVRIIVEQLITVCISELPKQIQITKTIKNKNKNENIKQEVQIQMSTTRLCRASNVLRDILMDSILCSWLNDVLIQKIFVLGISILQSVGDGTLAMDPCDSVKSVKSRSHIWMIESSVIRLLSQVTQRLLGNTQCYPLVLGSYSVNMEVDVQESPVENKPLNLNIFLIRNINFISRIINLLSSSTVTSSSSTLVILSFLSRYSLGIESIDLMRHVILSDDQDFTLWTPSMDSGHIQLMSSNDHKDEYKKNEQMLLLSIFRNILIFVNSNDWMIRRNVAVLLFRWDIVNTIETIKMFLERKWMKSLNTTLRFNLMHIMIEIVELLLHEKSQRGEGINDNFTEITRGALHSIQQEIQLSKCVPLLWKLKNIEQRLICWKDGKHLSSQYVMNKSDETNNNDKMRIKLKNGNRPSKSKIISLITPSYFLDRSTDCFKLCIYHSITYKELISEVCDSTSVLDLIFISQSYIHRKTSINKEHDMVKDFNSSISIDNKNISTDIPVNVERWKELRKSLFVDIFSTTLDPRMIIDIPMISQKIKVLDVEIPILQEMLKEFFCGLEEHGYDMLNEGRIYEIFVIITNSLPQILDDTNIKIIKGLMKGGLYLHSSLVKMITTQ